jgi:hypothetical protein
LPWTEAIKASYVDINDTIPHFNDTSPSVIDDEKIQGEMLSNSLNDKFRDKMFIGPSWDKKSKMFKCHLRCHPLRETSFYLGAYILEVDAALAYDKGVDALQLNDVRQKNFTESADYEKARQIELLDLDRRGICIDDVGSLEEVANHIECMVAKKCQGFENNMYYTDVSARSSLAQTGTSQRTSSRPNFKLVLPSTILVYIILWLTRHWHTTRQ